MTAVYNKLGISFMYPENWKLLDETDGTPHVVTLESPDGSSTWSVHVYDRDHDPGEVLKETLVALEEAYSDAEISELEGDGFDRLKQMPGIDGEAIQGVEAMFYCLDFLIRARLCLIGTDQHWLLVWSQAEDRDFDKLEIIFSAMTISLLQTVDAE